MARKKTLTKEQRLNFWVHGSMYDRILALAKSRGWTMAEAGRHLLSVGLENDDQPSLRAEIAELKRRMDILSNGVLNEPGSE